MSGLRRARAAVGALVLLLLVGVDSVAPPAGAVVYPDRPDTRGAAAAAAAEPRNSWRRDVIDAADDIDWFKFALPTSSWMRITLGDLPHDYSLDLYTSSGSLVGSSRHGGRRFERIYRPAHAGLYFVRVSSASGAFDAAHAYSLLFQSLPEKVVVLNAFVSDPGGSSSPEYFAGDVLNNTSQWRQVEIWAHLPDNSNALSGLVFEFVPPRAVAHFQAFLSGHGSIAANRLFPTSSAVSTRAYRVTNTPGTPVDDAGTRHFTGAVHNLTPCLISQLIEQVAYYDARGRMINFAADGQSALSPHATLHYAIDLPAIDANYTQYSVSTLSLDIILGRISYPLPAPAACAS